MADKPQHLLDGYKVLDLKQFLMAPTLAHEGPELLEGLSLFGD